MNFSPGNLHLQLQSMPPGKVAVIGLSGGLDSVVLLHALVQLRAGDLLPFSLRALHVNHGLSPNAAQWEQLCATLCREWEVVYHSRALDLAEAVLSGSGIESAARNGRYAAFTEQLGHNEALLLAHHRDDQMETQLLRLMRGAGPRGLAGMPRSRSLGQGFLYRPLLQFNRSDLLAYAHHNKLQWIDDESNLAQQFDRNYCRHTLLPLIEARWPAYRESWSKSAALQAEADVLMQELAEGDLQQLRAPAVDAATNALQLDALIQLSQPRQRNLLRRWLVQLGLPEPGWNELQQLTEAVIPARPDSNASWHGAGYVITRFKNQLLVMKELPAIDQSVEFSWHPVKQPKFPLPDNGCLQARPSRGDAADIRLAISVANTLQVRYRHGGESCRLRGRPDKSLKKILQEQAMPPWCRERLPLIYAGTNLICLPGIGVTEHATADGPEPKLVIDWQPPDWMAGIK